MAEVADTIDFQSEGDYRDWLARLAAFPARVEQTITLLREAIAKKLVHPRVVMDRITAQLDRQIVEDAEKSPFFKPFRTVAASIPAPTADALRSEAKRAVLSQICRPSASSKRSSRANICRPRPPKWAPGSGRTERSSTASTFGVTPPPISPPTKSTKRASPR
jgi:uncharacterized protein (DUF885 family)